MDLDPKRAYFLVFVDRKPRFCVHIDSEPCNVIRTDDKGILGRSWFIYNQSTMRGWHTMSQRHGGTHMSYEGRV